MGFIRNFKLCRFTYGYTRVSAVPVVEKHHINECRCGSTCSRQVQMDQGGSAYADLRHHAGKRGVLRAARPGDRIPRGYPQLGLTDASPWTKASGVPLGASFWNGAQPMQRFLTNVHREQPPFAYYYTYTLLHTYSHVMMRAISELSGLDAGSLGEYLFPADLAFVVYRSGTTARSGQPVVAVAQLRTPLPAPPRRANLARLVIREACVRSGAALARTASLIPETSCIAYNQLLSRSVLRGGRRPREDSGKDRIPGYLDVVQAALAADPAPRLRRLMAVARARSNARCRRGPIALGRRSSRWRRTRRSRDRSAARPHRGSSPGSPPARHLRLRRYRRGSQ